MTRKTITLRIFVLTVLAVTLGIMLSIGAVHLKDKPPVVLDRHAFAGSGGFAELPNADGRFTRVRLLLR